MEPRTAAGTCPVCRKLAHKWEHAIKPTTTAGRAWWDNLRDGSPYRDIILAIEAEATRDALVAALAAVENVDHGHSYGNDGCIAAIDALREDADVER